MLGLSCGFDFVGCKQLRDVKLRCVYQMTLDEKGATGGSPWKPHEVTKNTSYRIWNPVSM